MPAAYSADLAWRVVWYILWYVFDADENEEKEHLPDWAPAAVAPLYFVSPKYVRSVWQRYWQTGDVATYQGQSSVEAQLNARAVDTVDEMNIIHSIMMHPRWQLKEHRAAVCAESKKHITYESFCRAVWRLGYTRKHIRSLCYKADRDKAAAWLAEILTFFDLSQLVCLDETSKDLGALKGSFGYSLRGTPCVCHDLPALSHGTRISALTVFTPYEGFLDWALTTGTFTTDLFVHVTTEQHLDHHGKIRGPILLDHLSAYPGYRSCVLLDNASIHGNVHKANRPSKDARFVARLAERGAVVRYIPPYCWFLSPLDNGAYGRLVAWLRANECGVRE